MKRSTLMLASCLALAGAFTAMAGAACAAAPKFAAIYHFKGGSDGANPAGRLVADAAGNLYGTTNYGGRTGCSGFGDGCGTVFELKPPSTQGGAWTETILHRFTGGSDGDEPLAGLAIDGAGNLFGTTAFGGMQGTGCQVQGIGCGTVFELSPPAAGRRAWTFTTLHDFTGASDGGNPFGDVTLDTAGNLYGTTYEGGPYGYSTVFEMSPPSKPGARWTESVLYGFPLDKNGNDSGGWRPEAGVVLDAAGNIYGTTTDGGFQEQGVVFKLTPAPRGHPWHETVLVTFNGANGFWPLADLSFDGSGNLYGTTLDGGSGGCAGGTVFKLAAPSWQQTTIHTFCDGADGGTPRGSVIVDASGNVFGAAPNYGAYSNGTIYELMPPARHGGAWTEATLYGFHGRRDGSLPSAGLLARGAALFGTAYDGGTGGCQLHGQAANCGVVFEVVP